MFKSRIQELRTERGINMKQAAQALCIPYTTYVGYEKGEREPDSAMLIRLADFYNSSIDYLLMRSDERIDEEVLDKVNSIDLELLQRKGNIHDALLAEKKEELINKYRDLDDHGKKMVDFTLNEEYARCASVLEQEEEQPKIIEIKLMRLPASAGTGDYLDSEEYEYISAHRTTATEQADFAVRVNGDSMEPTYHDGDILLVEGAPYINVGMIGVFVVNGCGYVKEYGGDRLISHNEKYDDILLHDYDVVMCSGRVIGVLES